MFVIYDTNTNEIVSWSNVSKTPPSGCAEIETENYIDQVHRYYDAATDTFSGPTEAEQYATDMQVLRQKRNALLAQSDWTQAIDSPLTDAQKQAWQTYRSTLRSLPENTVDPRNPTWPEKPS